MSIEIAAQSSHASPILVTGAAGAVLTAMHRAIDGCGRIYFGMSVSADYLTATVNTAAVARHHDVEAFVNMSQMTLNEHHREQRQSAAQASLVSGTGFILVRSPRRHDAAHGLS
jgi:hypothetical protein